MAKAFNVVIVTPEKTAYEGQVFSATIPGLVGYLGVWADHAPLIGATVPGLVSLKLSESGSMQFLAVGTGFVEISDNVVNLMVETCEAAGEIDVERAAKALERAKGRLREMDHTLDRERARLAQSRAEARLKAAKKTS